MKTVRKMKYKGRLRILHEMDRGGRSQQYPAGERQIRHADRALVGFYCNKGKGRERERLREKEKAIQREKGGGRREKQAEFSSFKGIGYCLPCTWVQCGDDTLSGP